MLLFSGSGRGENDIEIRGRSRNARRDDPRRHTLAGDQQYGGMAGQGGSLARTMDLERIRNKWETDGTVDKRKPTGRPKIIEDNALVQYLEQNPFHVMRAAIQRTDFPGSRPTACRRIKESSLKNYVATKKMILGNEHKQARIIFALNNILRENWDRVIFTDEKVFQSTNNGQIRVYRPRRTRFNKNFVSNLGGFQ
ncbi:hypothetical protein MML48_3g00004092 [Holotrichia oblita]|uniref:Uncharacterized protein n=1 Tax=Holotrichia oblita TaxID=644536 RepID=A0ACB9TFK5_HOLOL|nr:hypothetical protein MML48_3g00004092 [Holotrichia oblita]